MNPLIAKWEELKKPAPINNKIQHELDPEFVEKLKDVDTLNTLSTIGITSGPAITASNYYTSTNSTINYNPIPVTTFDVDNCKQQYLQVAEMLKNGKARVTNMTTEFNFNTYYKNDEHKVIFEVILDH